ncbi:MAG: M20/M25/M40 family metallo-hydrolase, partial [Pseudomonadota bacterium]
EDEPHPVGSNANQRVKQRIKDWLSKEGISFEEQRAWACAQKYPSCSSVENIIAVLPGQVAGPHVAMMAHYDSVPHAPGAGDDMAGVVAVLEAARAAKAVGDFRHPIALLITDSEETGLHGAHAFFQQHPLAENIGVLLNVEGSGTRGVSQVLRTAGANRWYMELFEDHAKQPAGTSLANEIFKRMPNDTDFSVAMAASVPGIDFAFAAERNHYHTMNDSVANLDPRTVQHHGDNLFPLVLELANSSLEATDDSRAVYHQTYGLWAQWPE